jgi:hypothetical protein
MQQLITRCAECSYYLRWTEPSTPTKCGRCGADLRLQDAPDVRPQDRDDLGFVADLVSVDPIRQHRALLRLPPNVRVLNRGSIIELALVLGWSDGKIERHCAPLPSNPFQDYPHDLIAGIKILRNFSTAIQERIPKDAFLPEFLLNLQHFSRAAVTTSTRDFVLDLCGQHSFKGKKTLERIKSEREERWKLNITQAAQFMRVEKSTVRSIVRAGLMQRYRVKDWRRKADWFEEIEVARVGSILSNKISVNDAVGRTGIPFHALEQLNGLAVLPLCQDKIIKLAFIGRFFNGTEFELFESQLRKLLSKTEVDTSDRISLRTCFNVLGRQYKPWGAVISAALDETLPGGLGIYDPAGKLTAKNLTVSRRLPDLMINGLWSADAVPQPARSYCSWAETEEYLNCYPRDVAALLSEFDELQMVDHGAAGIDRASVLKVGAEFISSAEIGARTNLGPFFVAKWARKRGLERPDNNFPMWRRRDVEPFLRYVPVLFRRLKPLIEVDLHSRETEIEDLEVEGNISAEC